jgi:hypothetical protein
MAIAGSLKKVMVSAAAAGIRTQDLSAQGQEPYKADNICGHNVRKGPGHMGQLVHWFRFGIGALKRRMGPVCWFDYGIGALGKEDGTSKYMGSIRNRGARKGGWDQYVGSIRNQGSLMEDGLVYWFDSASGRLNGGWASIWSDSASGCLNGGWGIYLV